MAETFDYAAHFMIKAVRKAGIVFPITKAEAIAKAGTAQVRVDFDKYVSLASIMCAFLYPLLLGAFFPGGWVVLMGILTTCFVVFMHRENIKRLYNGKESKISLSFKKKSPPSEGTGGNG
jgi:glycerol-3-phosphate acyltransferase PlsY